jgi:Domain of unknown function (DUF305)
MIDPDPHRASRRSRAGSHTNADRRQLGARGAPLAIALVIALASGVHGGGEVRGTDEFRTLMDDAVERMHRAMHVGFTGDVDRDFARMMIPHHQGAIDMALAELRYGKDSRLKRLAKEIIVEQQQEIAVMRLALGEALPPGAPAPSQVRPESDGR